MKRRKKNTSLRFKITAYQPSSRKTMADLEPEEFAVYVRRAEKKALPTIKEMRLGPGSALVLVAQHAQLLATGGIHSAWRRHSTWHQGDIRRNRQTP